MDKEKSDYEKHCEAILNAPWKCEACRESIVPKGDEKRYLVSRARRGFFHNKDCYLQYMRNQINLHKGWIEDLKELAEMEVSVKLE